MKGPVGSNRKGVFLPPSKENRLVRLSTFFSTASKRYNTRPKQRPSGHSAAAPVVGTAVDTPGVPRDQEVSGMVYDRPPATVQRRRDAGSRQRADLVVGERGEAPEVHGHLSSQREVFDFRRKSERGMQGGGAPGGSGDGGHVCRQYI